MPAVTTPAAAQPALTRSPATRSPATRSPATKPPATKPRATKPRATSAAAARKPIPSAHPAVDAYLAHAAPFAQPILKYLRDIVHLAAPETVEEIKWSRPFFLYRGIILGNLSAFQQHCSFGLWGKQIADRLRANGVASKQGMGTFGRITTLADLPPRAELVAYVREAARGIAEGERTASLTRPRVAKAEVATPAALTAALAGNSAAARSFAAMSPSRRKEYSVWVAGARREETRDRRVATALEWIAQGKRQSWKYEQA